MAYIRLLVFHTIGNCTKFGQKILENIMGTYIEWAEFIDYVAISISVFPPRHSGSYFNGKKLSMPI